TTAILGRFPSALLFGRRVRLASMGVSAQAVMLGIVISRRHLPTWMTTGTSFVTERVETSIENFPASSESAAAMGLPEKFPSHVSQAAPSAIGLRGSLGTYTTTL